MSTSPLPPALSPRVDDARPLANSVPARAARRASALLARLANTKSHHLVACLYDAPSPRHSPSSCRPSTPTSPLPIALSSCVTDARPLASAAPAHAARRAGVPLARRSHLRGIASLLELSLTPITAPPPEVVSAFRADPAVAGLAVAALRRFLPFFK